MLTTLFRNPGPAIFALVFSLLGAPALAAPAPTASLFEPGDRWIAIGDSITQNGRYLDWTALYLLLRSPDSSPTLQNAGISGDSAAGALRRFEWDILPADRSSTVATIMLGMNDVGRDLYAPDKSDDDALQLLRQTRLDHYARSLRALVNQLQARGLRVALVTPSPYDDTSLVATPNLPGTNAALARCADLVRDLARDTGCTVVDLHGPLTALVARLQAASPAAVPMGRDRVHPDDAGHFTMAYHLIRAHHPAGPITRVHLHGPAGAPRQLDSAILSDASGNITSAAGWTATYLARSLPFPVPEGARAALDWVPFTSELNTESLRATGLPAGRYILEIDGHPVGEFSEERLAAGINLAELPTPQRAQAENVAAILQRRREIVQNLRLLAKVEHWQAGDAKPPFTLAGMEASLVAWEKKLQAQPGHWEATHPARYRALKPVENDLVAQADTLLAEARAAARPLPRPLRLYPAPHTPDAANAR